MAVIVKCLSALSWRSIILLSITAFGNLIASEYNLIASQVPVKNPIFIINDEQVSTDQAVKMYRSRPADQYLEELFKPYLKPTYVDLGTKALQGIYEYPRFEGVRLFGPLRWNENPLNNDTWEWSHHSLTVLDYLMSGFLFTAEEKYLEGVISLTHSWMEHNFNVSEFPSEFSWNDHTTAIRVWRLLYLFEYGRRSQLVTDEFLEKVILLLYHHAMVLRKDDFFNRFTNHGYYQAVALYLATAILHEIKQFPEINQLAAERLKNEVAFMFTPDGVHVENSSAYHWFLTNSVKDLINILTHFRYPIESMKLVKTLDDAVGFTTYAMKPDGTLPLVGDSAQLSPYGLNTIPLKNYEHFRYAISKGQDGMPPQQVDAIFPLAGYAIFRDSWRESRSFTDTVYVYFKCGFLSNYHRHDDDLMLLLSGLGEDWLVDSGSYNYQEQDPIRIYMRSNRAHNVPVIHGSLPTRDLRQVRKGTGIQRFSISENYSDVHGVSTIYSNLNVHRHVEYLKPFRIIMTDHLEAADNFELPRWSTLFQVPIDKRIFVRDQEVFLISSNGNQLQIKIPPNSKVSIFSGCTERIQGCRSERLNNAKPIQSIEISHSPNTASVMYYLTLIPVITADP